MMLHPRLLNTLDPLSHTEGGDILARAYESPRVSLSYSFHYGADSLCLSTVMLAYLYR